MQPRIIDLPKVEDPRGNLTFLQSPGALPFDVKRVFWTYDVPGGDVRGGHAYKQQQEVIIALCGSFDVKTVDQEGVERIFHMNRSYVGLWLPPMVWRHIENFSTNAISLHLSDREFDAGDYIRDHGNFEQKKP
ncbi:MAG: FdtA/QdtA family cupin domain-containing protein [Bacteroidota bacterium]|nr:FdtA/QdtA family cupin domain-containing protein [Bacteroidota bacterium]MDX5447769.1 FdtA/QdtA family cupin domain-containing protein [Bacteroidota bacterium]